MRKLNTNKGFTIIELIVVIAILAILAAIISPQAFEFIERGRIAADQTTVRTLNNLTALYRITAPSSDPFKDTSKTNSELIAVLVDGGFLTSSVESQTKNTTFEWLIEDEQWYLMFEDSFYVIGSLNDGLYMDTRGNGELLGPYTGSSKDIVIPKTLNNETIKAVWQDSFRGSNLVAVHFPNDSEITVIGRRAFRENQLTEVTLPGSLTMIGDHAFRLNPNLKKVTIGDDVTIGDAAFGFNRDDNTFRDVYESNGKSAGTYVFIDGNWIKQ